VKSFKERIKHPGFYVIRFPHLLLENAEEALQYLERGATATICGKVYNLSQIAEMMEKSPSRWYIEYQPGKSRELVL
jgi:collagenase-like PrtC family protease